MGAVDRAEPLWMQALEAQLKALTMMRKIKGLAEVDTAGRKIFNENGFGVDAPILLKATPFAWSRETIEAVSAAGASIPADTAFNQWNLPGEACWWWFEKPLRFRTTSGYDPGVRALSFGPVNEFGYVCCSAWLDDPDFGFGIAPSQTWTWAAGQTLDDMLRRGRLEHDKRYGPGAPYEHSEQIGAKAFIEAADGLSRFVLAGVAWLGQKILVTAEGHIERHRRKDFNRQTGQTLEGVKVVSLRRVERPPTSGSGEVVEWSHRWVVDGHWRNQPCGLKSADRKLIYVLPFIKGPDDKPLVAKTKVYKVDR